MGSGLIELLTGRIGSTRRGAHGSCTATRKPLSAGDLLLSHCERAQQHPRCGFRQTVLGQFVAGGPRYVGDVACRPGLAAAPIDRILGNLVTTNSSSVTLAVATGPGLLSGTFTVAASGGVATFSNLLLDTAGAHTLIAGDGGTYEQ